jgi:transketolase
MTWYALEAARSLEKKGVDAEVLNFHTIKPFDYKLLIESAQKTGAVVSAEEHNRFGGLGDMAAQYLAIHHPTPMRFIGTQDTFGESGKPTELLKKYGLSPQHIHAAAVDLLNTANSKYAQNEK